MWVRTVPPPRAWLRPCTIRSSPSISISTPFARRPSATAASRSDSLTRNSLSPRITVMPSAKLAATARTGYSSIMDGARAAGTSIPRSADPRIRTSAISSPPSLRTSSASMSAPISRSVTISPVRSGLVMTAVRMTSEPGTIRAATIGKAAEGGWAGACPDQLDGVENSPHRPLAQAGIAIEGGGDRTARHRSHDQTATGARIAEIEHGLRLPEPADPDTVNAPGALTYPLDGRPQRPHGLGGVDHVLAFQQAGNVRLPDRQRPKDKGTVRDRLVSGHAQAAFEGARAACRERGWDGVIHLQSRLCGKTLSSMRPYRRHPGPELAHERASGSCSGAI